MDSGQLLPGKQTPWDAVTNSPPEPGIAAAVVPSKERIDKVRGQAEEFITHEPQARPSGWTPGWKEALVNGISGIIAAHQLQGPRVSALPVPRFVHCQAQGICDLFGARVERQPDGKYFVHPVIGNTQDVERIGIRPLEESVYWGAVTWIKYAGAATRNAFQFNNPVMGGPLDIASFLMGPTRLLEWVHTEPGAVHSLLKKITETIIGMYTALKEAAGGSLHPLHFLCLANAFDLCSECRSLVSADIFEEFDLPCLRRIGEALGPYGIHSCGSWERTVPGSLGDSNLKGMNGQVRENDLRTLCRLADGRILLSIRPSINLDSRYTWPDRESFFEHVLETVPAQQPLEIRIDESEMELYREMYFRIRDCRQKSA